MKSIIFIYLLRSALGFDVVRDRIVAQTRGKVPQKHATAVQRPHRIF